MTTLATLPTLVSPGKSANVSFSLTKPGSNFVRVWCTVAPTGSKLDGEINSSSDPRSRVKVFEGLPSVEWKTSFDKGGKYTFVAQEYVKGTAHGGGFEGDPTAAETETKVGSETTIYLYVGQRVTQPIGPSNNQATLVLWVWNDTIRETTLSQHGEVSPAIIAQSPTPRARTAIESDSVLSALDDLIDQPVTTAAGDLEELVANYCAVWDFHVFEHGPHISQDEYNLFTASDYNASGVTDFPQLVNKGLRLMVRHFTNDIGVADGDGVSGPDTGGFHNPTTELKVSDRVNLPLYQAVSALPDAYGGFAELRRCLSAHVISEDVHAPPIEETDPPLVALPPIMAVHAAYCAIVASVDPAVPPAQSSGVQFLVSSAGFKEG